MDFVSKHGRVLELLLVAFLVLYGAVINAREVPAIREALAEVKTRVSVLESRFEDIQNTLGRIEQKMDRRR